MPYILRVHPNDNQSRHIVLDSIMFDTIKGLVVLVNNIANLNKWILGLGIWKFYILLFVTCIHFNLSMCQSLWSLIMLGLMHDLSKFKVSNRFPWSNWNMCCQPRYTKNVRWSLVQTLVFIDNWRFFQLQCMFSIYNHSKKIKIVLQLKLMYNDVFCTVNF